MTEEIKQDRSPKSPKFPLEDAINYARKLYDNAGRSVIPREMVAKAMGYGGLNGAALTTLATLAQYGLLERQGAKLGVSPLTLRIFHPGAEGPDPAIREAALSPVIFRSIFENHHQLSEPLLMNHLVHQGFNQDAAKKGAAVYKENSAFAKLDVEDVETGGREALPEPSRPSYPNPIAARVAASSQVLSPIDLRHSLSLAHVVTQPENVTKQFHLPLDEGSSVELRFMGNTEFGVEQIDSLVDILEFLKKQLLRRKATEAKLPAITAPTLE